MARPEIACKTSQALELQAPSRVHGTPRPNFLARTVFQVHGKTHNLSDSKQAEVEREKREEEEEDQRSSKTATVNARVHFPGQHSRQQMAANPSHVHFLG